MIGDGILLVEDQDSARAMFARYLASLGYEVTGARTLAEAKGAVREYMPRGILLDLGLPDGNSLDWIPHLRMEYPAMAIIVITGIGDIPTAVEAMRRGADHFMTKPVDMQELEVFLARSLDVGGASEAAPHPPEASERDGPVLAALAFVPEGEGACRNGCVQRPPRSPPR